MKDPVELIDHQLAALDLPPVAQQALAVVRRALDSAYRDRFISMTEAINKQAAALDRIQRTLEVLIEAVKPELAAGIPPAIRIAESDEDPDLASAVVVADPLAAGFNLTQKNIADALGLSAPAVSVLIRAFKLHNDPRLAVTVRRGSGRPVVNYRREVVDQFRRLILNPPDGLRLPKEAQSKLARAQRRLSE